MCWISHESPVERTAKEDIYTYKIVYNLDKLSCTSPIKAFIYEYYKLYTQSKVIIPFRANIDTWIIEEGFHSYKTWLKAKIVFDNFFGDSSYSIRKKPRIVQCIIPKGTTFYTNEAYEIVSNDIIITDSTKVLPPKKLDYPQKKWLLMFLKVIIAGCVTFLLSKLIWYVLVK